MGQLAIPQTKDILLTAVDRLTARNVGGGINPGASHLVIFGENAGANLGDVDNLIIIGAGALDAGLNDLNAAGSIAIGVNALGALTSLPFAGFQEPDVAIGLNALALSANSGACVIIGANAFASLSGGIASGVTAVGCNIHRNNVNPPNFSNSTFVGFSIASGFAGHGMSNCTIVGAGAMGSTTVGVGNVWAGITAIGTGVLSSITGVNAGSSGVYIGHGCTPNKNSGTNEIMIGAGIVNTDGANNVSIGTGNVVNAAVNLVQIGVGIDGARGNRSIIIGSGAGAGETTPTQADLLIIETSVAGTRRTAMYGDMSAGNLIIGLSTPGTDRDMHGSNTLKLLDGGKGAGNPVGGGFFYVLAGALHWVGSAGTDTVIAPA